MGISWNLRLRMAEKGLFQTSDLVPLLAERGVNLSREQVYRLVTQATQRLSMDARTYKPPRRLVLARASVELCRFIPLAQPTAPAVVEPAEAPCRAAAEAEYVKVR
ncbi:hypothetical protein [Kitasatospora aureofaciens]|uniref:hypothetical protein n=1 Tax=Kitasatospora aureofaciens TaxID=1894 RepID=UPI0037C7BE31